MARVTLAAVGDVMCGDSFYAAGSGAATSIATFGPQFLPDETTALLRPNDLVFGNLECVLSDRGHRKTSLRSLHMRGEPATARHLASWGFNLLSVANNHILEHGVDAARDTVHHLDEAGIRAVGAGGGRSFEPGPDVVDVDLDGVHVSVVAHCSLDERYAFDGGLDAQQLTALVSQVADDSDVVVVSLHWGHELMDRPSRDQRRLARDLVSAGATVILGHHPHVVQGVEQFGGSLVAYSLGNFIFNGFDPDTQWGAILTATIQDGSVVDWSTIPVEKDADHRPHLASGDRYDVLSAELERRHDLVAGGAVDGDGDGDSDADADYLAEFVARRELNRSRLRHHLRSTLREYPKALVPQLMYRPVQRRLGRW